MDTFIQILISGLISGSIYALIAVGFSLIYSTCRFAHFAHGGIIAISAYLFYTFFTVLHLPFWLAIIFVVAGAIIVDILLFILVYEPLMKRRSSPAIMLIASITVLGLIESILLIIYGGTVKIVAHNLWQFSGFLENVSITPIQFTIVIVALLLIYLLNQLMHHSRFGKAMRAVSVNPNVAEIVGISVRQIEIFAFALSAILGAFAGILIALEFNIIPTMGTMLMIKGFTAAIIGGIGSVPYAIAGAFLLGTSENFAAWILPSQFKDAVAFVLLLIFLLFRRQGIAPNKSTLHK